MVYGSLVDSNYLNSLAIRSFNWNSTILPEDKAETLAYIAEGLDQGVWKIEYVQHYHDFCILQYLIIPYFLIHYINFHF